MMARLHAVVVPLLSSLLGAVAETGNSDLRRGGRNRVDSIACPVLAGLYRRGHLNPDEDGKVDAVELRQALEATGVSAPFAFFQATGIAGYLADDPHQNVRRAGAQSFVRTLYVNILTMNPGDNCAAAGERTKEGFPCNANTQFQQHGYSTTMRDSRFDGEDPDRKKRFDFWIGQELVDPSSAPEQLETKQRVLLVDGFARVLGKARAGNGSLMFSGDFSGEYSLRNNGQWEGSNIKYFHPSVTEPFKYTALATWQPLLAWTGWWVAFSRRKGKMLYFTESDLKGFFMRGEFPEDWQARSWGFQQNFDTTIALKGNGLGEEWISTVKHMMLSDDAILAEARYNLKLAKALIDLGMLQDDTHDTWQPSRVIGSIVV